MCYTAFFYFFMSNQMPLSEVEKQHIQFFKTACFDSDIFNMHTQYIFLTEYYNLRDELDFQIIPDLLIALSAQKTETSQTTARWLIAPERFNPDQPHSLEYSIPKALLVKTRNNPEQFERLLDCEVTNSLFTLSHRGLLSKFVRSIIDSDEATVQLLLQHFPALSNLHINDNTSPLTLALSLDTINEPVIQALLAAGANPNGDIAPNAQHFFYEQAKNPTHRPLHQAIIRGKIAVAQLLIDADNIDLERADGFQVNRPNAPDMQLSTSLIYQSEPRWTTKRLTPALIAGEYKSTAVLDLLAEKGIELPNHKNKRKNFFEENNENNKTGSSRQDAPHSSESAPAPQSTTLDNRVSILSIR